MALEKGFLRPSLLVDRYTIATGVMSGLLFSFSFYGLLYMFREAIRIMTSWFGGMTLLELSPRENFLYNLFYASIAVIFGLQVCLKFILENNINHQQKKLRFRQRQTINDITSLSSVFLFFFAKTGATFGLMLITLPLQYDIDFISEFWLFLLLIPITLFLNIWMTVTRTFGRLGYKWLSISLGAVVALSLCYANVNFLDYKSINKNINSHSVELSHKIDLPRTINNQYVSERRSRIINIYLVSKGLNKGKPKLFWEDASMEIEFSELAQQIIKEKEERSEFDRDLISYNLHIDQHINMSFVEGLNEALRKAGIIRVYYSTTQKNSKYPSHYPYFKRLGIRHFLYPFYPEFEQFLDSAEQIDFNKYLIKTPESVYHRINYVKQHNRVEIRVAKNTVYLNNRETDLTSLKTLIQDLQKRYSPKFLVILSYEGNTEYGRYIEVIDLLRSIHVQLKNEFTQSEFNKPYESVEYTGYRLQRDTAYRTADKKYPPILFEWTVEERRLNRLLEKSKARLKSSK